VFTAEALPIVSLPVTPCSYTTAEAVLVTSVVVVLWFAYSGVYTIAIFYKFFKVKQCKNRAPIYTDALLKEAVVLPFPFSQIVIDGAIGVIRSGL
jgi:hypothetical protein